MSREKSFARMAFSARIKFNCSFFVLSNVYHKHLTQGFSPTLLRNILSGGTYFMVFDTLRIYRAEHHHCTIKEIPVIETFVCGGIAGLFYWGPCVFISIVNAGHYLTKLSQTIPLT